MSDSKDINLRSIAIGRADDRLRVAVALGVARPDEACLTRLRSLGLSIDRIVGNKVLGSVKASDKSALLADPDVVEVEVGTKLSLQ